MLNSNFTSASSAGVPGSPTRVASRACPTEFAAAPFASGVPTVRYGDRLTGGAHDGWASGGPCVRLMGLIPHWTYSGTRDTISGLAPAGRTWQQASFVSIPLRFRRPPEATPFEPLRDVFGSTPSRMAFLTPATSANGSFAKASAAAPATCGLAIEVPWLSLYSVEAE